MGRADTGVREVGSAEMTRGELVSSICHFERERCSKICDPAEADCVF